MTVEEELQDFILSKYQSLRDFTIKNHLPYSTLSTMLRRGVNNTSWKTILKICNALEISADDLADGHVVERNESMTWQDKKLLDAYTSALMNDEDMQVLHAYRAADPGTKAAVRKLLDISPPASEQTAT